MSPVTAVMHAAFSVGIPAATKVHPLHVISCAHTSPASAGGPPSSVEEPPSGSALASESGAVVHGVVHAVHPPSSVVAQAVQPVVHAASVAEQLLATQLAQDEPTIPERSDCAHGTGGPASAEGVPSLPDPESFALDDASPPLPGLAPKPPLLEEHPKSATHEPDSATHVTALRTATSHFTSSPIFFDHP